MSEFSIVGSRPLATAGFLEITGEQVEGPDGDRFERVVIHHPGAVVVVPVEDDGEHVRLVRQWRAPVGGELLEVPAGKRDVDGEPPHETAARELAEEIGCRPGRLVQLAEFFNTPGFCDEYSYLFVALDLVELAERAPVHAEEAAMTVERVRLSEVDALIANRELIDAKTILGLTLTRRYLAGELAGEDVTLAPGG